MENNYQTLKQFCQIIPISRTEKIKKLAKKSIEEKWNTSETNLASITVSCPFCFDTLRYSENSITRKSSHNCNRCICPKLICNSYAYKGFVSILKWNNFKLISKITGDFKIIFKAFEELAENGEISIGTQNLMREILLNGKL
jgi:hypothetical protein